MEKKQTAVQWPIDILQPEMSQNPMLPAVFSSTDMVSFGYFIRDNYYGVGTPKLMSYRPEKYPHGAIPEIFHYWCLENGR